MGVVKKADEVLLFSGRGVGFAGEVYLALVVVAPPRLIKGDVSRFTGEVYLALEHFRPYI